MEGQVTAKRIDPRIDRTRKLISDAFYAVMNERGFEALTVNDIAERAGINRVTFYDHYVDKYELLGAEVRKDFTAAVEAQGLLERKLSTESVRELFAMICTWVKSTYDHCKPPHSHLAWVMEHEVTAFTAALLERWAGTAHAWDDAGLVTAAASSALYGLVVRWTRADPPIDVEPFVAKSLHLVTAVLKLS